MFTKDDLFLSCLIACSELTVESNIVSKLFSQCDRYHRGVLSSTIADILLQEKFQFSISRVWNPDIIVMGLMTWFHYTHGLLLLYLLQIEALDPPYIRSRFQSFFKSHS